MTLHLSHNVRDTSLLMYMEEYEDINFNQKIRNKVHKEIIQLLQLNPQGLTDREMQYELKYNERNVVSPRRHELVYGTKKHPELKGIVEEKERRNCQTPLMKKSQVMISWVLNKNKLYAFMGI